MRIGTDLNASRLPRIISPSTPNLLGHAAISLVLIALCAGCNAVVSFPDFKFGPHKGSGKGDSGVTDSGLAADGGENETGDGGPIGTDQDGSVTSNDGGLVGDGSVTGGAGIGSDGGGGGTGGDQDSGPGGMDSGSMSCPSSVEVCDNGVDDDCDGQMDCDDSDCTGQTSCCSALPENTQGECGDLKDNDCNGKADCDDLNCSGTLACCVRTGAGTEASMAECTDGIDDDCDGKVDCADPQCSGLAACCGIVSQGIGGGSVSACCTPDGLNESDAPNDGKDNDCDGLTDIPQLLSAFPTQGLPSSGDEVRLNFMTELATGATLSCSTKRPGQTPAFTPCPLMGTAVKPFTSPQSADPMNNGLWITQVRWDFTDGKHSSSYTFRYYIHNSLNGTAHCAPFHTDAQYFTVANTILGGKDAGAFKQGLDTFLTSPFIRVKYLLPVASATKYLMNGETPSQDMWSLRRRFTLNSTIPTAPTIPTSRYLLITRNYKATRGGSCKAANFAVHVTHWKSTNANNVHRYTCDVVVINRAGTGVCMDNAPNSSMSPVLTTSKSSWDSFVLSTDKWGGANKFMWRNLMDQSNTGFHNFTSKCSTTPCPGGLYLPDRSQFSP
jgi:hypothetical protein